MELPMAVAIELTRASGPAAGIIKPRPTIDPAPSELDDLTPLSAASTAEASAILILEDTHVPAGGELR
jgi:hypothetical protein